ncbi:MAG TPA: ABC transporter substrate-binding protein [Oligoflexia bacterium]|nr:ABC transporter substrate-binding protein [Oligoflexia bacterium]
MPGKQMLRFIALICILLCRAEAEAQQNNTTPPKRFRIGVSTPLTGPAATYGMDIWTSVQFAAEQLGGDRFELIAEDDKCDPREGVSIAQKFIHVEHVDAVIGPACSGPAAAAAPLYEQAETLVMLTNASAEKLADAGDYIFRSKPSDAEIIRTLWSYLRAHSKKLGLLCEQTDFALGMRDVLLRLNADGALAIVEEDFLPGTTDFRTALLKFRSAAIDGLLILPQAEAGLALALQQVRAMNWQVQIYGAHFPQSPTFLKLAGSNAEGIIFAATPFVEDILGNEGINLYHGYTAKYGEMRSIPLLFVTNFEGFRALRDSLLAPGGPRQHLYSATFRGIFGDYSFDKQGEIAGIRYQLKTIKSGRAVLLPLSQP